MKKISYLLILLSLILTSSKKDKDQDFIGDEGTFTDTRDGQEYKWIKIGEQIWMAENLKATNYSDNTTIPLVENSSTWEALGYTDKAYCYYDNSTSNGDI